MQISSSDGWLSASPMSPNQDVFRPITHTVSQTMFDISTYNDRINNTNSNLSTLPMNGSFESIHYNPSEPQRALNNNRRRERLHSCSSCYETGTSDLSSESNEEYEVGFKYVYPLFERISKVHSIIFFYELLEAITKIANSFSYY